MSPNARGHFIGINEKDLVWRGQRGASKVSPLSLGDKRVTWGQQVSPSPLLSACWKSLHNAFFASHLSSTGTIGRPNPYSWDRCAVTRRIDSISQRHHTLMTLAASGGGGMAVFRLLPPLLSSYSRLLGTYPHVVREVRGQPNASNTPRANIMIIPVSVRHVESR